jgi:hypothetical protein
MQVQVQAMQQKLTSLTQENERQSGIIMGLEQMVEEAGVEKLQLLKYCHELELRALAVDVMKENPREVAAEHSDSSLLLDLQQVCRRVIRLLDSHNLLAARRCFCCHVLDHTTTHVRPTRMLDAGCVMLCLQVRVRL